MSAPDPLVTAFRELTGRAFNPAYDMAAAVRARDATAGCDSVEAAWENLATDGLIPHSWVGGRLPRFVVPVETAHARIVHDPYQPPGPPRTQEVVAVWCPSPLAACHMAASAFHATYYRRFQRWLPLGEPGELLLPLGPVVFLGTYRVEPRWFNIGQELVCVSERVGDPYAVRFPHLRDERAVPFKVAHAREFGRYARIVQIAESLIAEVAQRMGWPPIRVQWAVQGVDTFRLHLAAASEGLDVGAAERACNALDVRMAAVILRTQDQLLGPDLGDAGILRIRTTWSELRAQVPEGVADRLLALLQLGVGVWQFCRTDVTLALPTSLLPALP